MKKEGKSHEIGFHSGLLSVMIQWRVAYCGITMVPRERVLELRKIQDMEVLGVTGWAICNSICLAMASMFGLAVRLFHWPS